MSLILSSKFLNFYKCYFFSNSFWASLVGSGLIMLLICLISEESYWTLISKWSSFLLTSSYILIVIWPFSNYDGSRLPNREVDDRFPISIVGAFLSLVNFLIIFNWLTSSSTSSYETFFIDFPFIPDGFLSDFFEGTPDYLFFGTIF